MERRCGPGGRGLRRPAAPIATATAVAIATTIATTIATSLQPAHAQGLLTGHPVVPSAGIAAENGPGTMWVNPANMAYDPDRRAAVFASRGGVDAPTSVAGIFGAGGMGIGLHNHIRPTPLGVANDWALDYGTSLSLPKRISAGLLLSWRFVQGGTNYVAYDAGLAWRPLPWLGVGGVAQNVGDPDPNAWVIPRTGAGIALRPAGSLVVLGADYVRLSRVDPNDGSVAEDHAVGTVRLRPVEGLYLRGSVDAVVGGAQPLSAATFSGGLEVYFGGVGGGYVASTDLSASGQTLFLGTDEPGESLIRSGRRVPRLQIDSPPPYQPRGGLFGSGEASWLDTLELLRQAEADPGIKGLVVELDSPGLSFARAAELRDRILRLVSADKPVLVYLTGAPGNADLYVASGGSRVALHPATDLRLTGLSVELTHLRGLLDLVGVEPQFVKRSDYKTAPETYTNVEPSMANLEMTEALVDDLYGDLVARIAEGREVEPDVVRGWIDGGPYAASEALKEGMVDVLLYPDQLGRELKDLHGGPVAGSDLHDMPQPRSPWEDPQQIAIVYVEGAIVAGESSPGGLLSGRTAGSKTVVKQLDRARVDPQVRAVVVRVDSPGGSSFASDEIWRATQRLRKKGKPVVVTMGSVAASGGYYVAAGADAIWAEPTTLTGSIGVFSGKFATDDLQKRLGVSTTVVARGRNASISSNTKPWDDLQRARMQALVDRTYAQFKERVADGRELDPEAVEELARGRVWSGRAAHERDLVDGLGGLPEAVADARERAGIRDNRKVGLVEFAPGGDLLESLAPALTQPANPLTGLARGLTRGLARAAGTGARQRAEADLAALEALTAPLDPLAPLALPLLHPDELVWLLDPYVLRVDGQ